MYMSTFNLKSEIVVKPAEVVNSYTLLNAVDSYFLKAVIATVSFNSKQAHRIIIWKGEEYEKIGQWTDSDLLAALHPAVEAYVARGFKNEEINPNQKDIPFVGNQTNQTN